jgi:hypothetical protein
LRKRYRAEGADADKNAPVTSTPQATAAQLPPPAPEEATKLPELDTESKSAVEAAALQRRLQEMENAERLARQVLEQQQKPQFATEPRKPQQPPPTTEQIIENSGLPDRARRWYRENPSFLTDPEKAAHIQHSHWIARREVGEEFTDRYFDRMEELLGFRPPAKSNGGNGGSALTPRAAAPVRQYSGPAVSAPPTRDVPSFSTGRPTGELSRLTTEEAALARSLEISPQEYAEQKQKMARLKQAGVIVDGQ